MKRMVSLAAGVAVGYVLGSRAGREKYEQIAAAARRYAGQLPIGETAGGAEAATGDAGKADMSGSGTGTPQAKTSAAPKRPRPSSRGRSAVAVEDREELRVAAKERIEDLPGETALGNADPAAGGHGDPKTYEGNQLP